MACLYSQFRICDYKRGVLDYQGHGATFRDQKIGFITNTVCNMSGYGETNFTGPDTLSYTTGEYSLFLSFPNTTRKAKKGKRRANFQIYKCKHYKLKAKYHLNGEIT